MARVFADDHHTPMAADHSALFTNLFNARSNLHRSLRTGTASPFDCSSEQSLVAVGDPAAGQVVGSQFYLHPVSRKNTDVMHPHLSGNMRQNLVAIFEFNPKHGIRERFGYRSFQDDGVFLGLSQNYFLL